MQLPCILYKQISRGIELVKQKRCTAYTLGLASTLGKSGREPEYRRVGFETEACHNTLGKAAVFEPVGLAWLQAAG